MGTLLVASWTWLPSFPVAFVISILGAAAFIGWIFLDCSFPAVANIARQDVHLQFIQDGYLRRWHRREWYGTRLVVFAILAMVGGMASLAAIFQFAFGDAAQRSWTSGLLLAAVVTIWFLLVTQQNRLWWLAFRCRVARLEPAMKKAAAQLLSHWPETSVYLPGLGNYSVSSADPDRLLHADPTFMPQLWETIGGISRKQDCCLGFGISSYLHFIGTTLHGCRVEYRMNGWSPPSTDVIEDRSPRLTKTIHHEYEFPYGEPPWYLAFYSTAFEFKDEVDPDVLAEVAKRPPTTRLPHGGNRFRALREIEVMVWIFHSFPDGQRSPMFMDTRALPTGEVARLDYEPDPSQSTHCRLIPEEHAGLEDRLVDSEYRKDRDYAGYSIQLSYIDLDTAFEWLGAEN